MAPFSSKFLEMLRTTLSRVETQAGLESDDPALLELKRTLVRSVATMETVAASKEEVGVDVRDADLGKSA